jgi:hypothetical protein
VIAAAIYLVVLFFLGLGNAVITYHLLRYRDAGDASVAVLVAYYVAVGIIIVGTALLVDWSEILSVATTF